MTDSQKLDLLLSEMKEVKADVHLLKEDTRTLKENTQTLNTRVQKLSERTDGMENRLVHMEVILENELRVNIQRIAEGHLDLSRNLHEAMKPNAEVEALSIRVGMLESDMRKVKAKLA